MMGTMASTTLALRASFVHCTGDPATDGPDACEHLDDAWLVVEDGIVAELRPAGAGPAPGADAVLDRRGKLVCPGFVDAHVHYPQVDVIASHGERLLEWLERYTFPAEARFADRAHADEVARFFLDRLLECGTTTALVFATVHEASVDAFFTEAERRNLRMLCGKVLMDRHAPDALLEPPDLARSRTRRLIRDWHGRGRLGYAVTPRFAPTSTDASLALAGRLVAEHRDLHGGVHLHTHLAENAEECRWVGELFPSDADYLAVYERHGLVGKRSVFAHGIHLDDGAWGRIAASGAAVAHCPTSNLFIGSGLFDLAAADRRGVPVGLGTDVGGGDSFSLLRTVNEAYKVAQLSGGSLGPERALYLATLGGARALDLDDRIGSFAPGREADFVVLDPAATPLLARRTGVAVDWRERLFALLMLGDERAVAETFVMGKAAGSG